MRKWFLFSFMSLVFMLGVEASVPKVDKPDKALEHLKSKGLNALATQRWNELSGREHAHAMSVAHSLGYEVVGDISKALVKAKESGQGFADFKKTMSENALINKWLGDVINAKGLEGKKALAYKRWRERIIYTTNMSTAYSAGRYRSQLKNSETRPFFRYKQEQQENKRESHSAYHTMVLSSTDPFWDTHYPPNGWNCHCYVQAISKAQAIRLGVSSSGDAQDLAKKNPIDEAWAYNVGLEMLAPDFSGYKKLGELKALKSVKENYVKAMNKSTLSKAEFTKVMKRVDKKEYRALGLNYQVGKLDTSLANTLKVDVKVMASDKALVHSQADKNAKQKISKDEFVQVFQTLNVPSRVYENLKPDHPDKGREIHFVRDLSKDLIIRAVLRQREGKSLQLVSYGKIPKGSEKTLGDKNLKSI